MISQNAIVYVGTCMPSLSKAFVCWCLFRFFDRQIGAIYVMAPIQAITLGIISLVVEKPWISIPKSDLFSNSVSTSHTIGIMVIGAVLAFAMVIAEFSLIQATSAVTFTVRRPAFFFFLSFLCA